MKTKPVLSQEALQALIKPLATTETLVPEATVVVSDVPATVVAETEVTLVETVAKAEFDAVTSELTALKASSETSLKGLADELLATTTALAEAEALSTEMKEILVGQVSRMRIGLGLAAVDMSKFSAKAVVEEYASASESFMKLPVGSVIPKEDNTPVVAPNAIQTSIDASAIKSLGF